MSQGGSAPSELRAQVAGASTDPFGPDVPDVATTAHALLWEAELSRLEDRATVDVWARAASQWDLLGRPHQAGYCRWRGAQAALRAGGREQAGKGSATFGGIDKSAARPSHEKSDYHTIQQSRQFLELRSRAMPKFPQQPQ